MLASALARSSAQTSFSAVLKAVVIVDHIMTASIAFTVCHPTVHILPNDSANNLRPASNIFVVEFILEHSFAHFPNEYWVPPNVFVEFVPTGRARRFGLSHKFTMESIVVGCPWGPPGTTTRDPDGIFRVARGIVSARVGHVRVPFAVDLP